MTEVDCALVHAFLWGGLVCSIIGWFSYRLIPAFVAIGLAFEFALLVVINTYVPLEIAQYLIGLSFVVSGLVATLWHCFHAGVELILSILLCQSLVGYWQTSANGLGVSIGTIAGIVVYVMLRLTPLYTWLGTIVLESLLYAFFVALIVLHWSIDNSLDLSQFCKANNADTRLDISMFIENSWVGVLTFALGVLRMIVLVYFLEIKQNHHTEPSAVTPIHHKQYVDSIESWNDQPDCSSNNNGRLTHLYRRISDATLTGDESLHIQA